MVWDDHRHGSIFPIIHHIRPEASHQEFINLLCFVIAFFKCLFIFVSMPCLLYVFLINTNGFVPGHKCLCMLGSDGVWHWRTSISLVWISWLMSIIQDSSSDKV